MRLGIPRLLILSLVVGSVVVGVLPVVKAGAKSNRPPSTKKRSSKPSPNSSHTPLFGLWQTDSGDVVDVILGYDGVTVGAALVAVFDGGGDCKTGGHRPSFVDGKVTAVGHIEGIMHLCTNDPVLFGKCHLSSVWESAFTANVLDKDHIAGYVKTEYYGSNPPDANGCPYHRDASRDDKQAFTMDRCAPAGCEAASGSGGGSDGPCPNVDLVKKAETHVGRAAMVTQKLSQWTAKAQKKDPALATAFERVGGALGSMSRTLGAVTAAKEDCDKAVEFIGKIQALLAAIDEINGAGCNTKALAAGFDHLFQEVGNDGEYVTSYVPELGPVFTILSQNASFFQNMEGKLDPYTAHNGQLGRIDGEVPPCQ